FGANVCAEDPALRRSDRGFGAAARLLLVSLAAFGFLTGCGTVSSSVSVDSALLTGQQLPQESGAASADDWMSQAVADDAVPAAVESSEGREAAAPSTQSDALTRVSGSIDGSELIQVSGAVYDQAADTGGSALVQQVKDDLSDTDVEEYDPWEPFNEKM